MAIDHSEIEDDALFGRIILRWGLVEIAVVNIVLRVIHPRFGLTGHNGVPVAFGGKIKLAKRGYKELHSLALLQEEAIPVLSELWSLSQTRNIIVHGYYQGVTGDDRYMFGFYDARGAIEGRSFKFHNFSRPEIETLADAIAKSREKLGVLSEKTFQIPFPPF